MLFLKTQERQVNFSLLTSNRVSTFYFPAGRLNIMFSASRLFFLFEFVFEFVFEFAVVFELKTNLPEFQNLITKKGPLSLAVLPYYIVKSD